MDAIKKRVRKVAIGIVGVLLCFCVSGCTVALKYSADISDDETEALQYSASLLWSLKVHPDPRDDYNIGIKDFDALELGKGIVAYDVSTETPIPTGVVVYPVYENRALVAVVQSATVEEETTYILSEEFVDGLKSFLKTNKEAVILVDTDCVIVRSKVRATVLVGENDHELLREYLGDFDEASFTETALVGRISLSVEGA
jgi:hypothetical protein